MKLLCVPFAVMLMLAGVPSSRAAVRISTSTGGDWNSVSSWTGGVVPVSADTAIIRGGASFTVSTPAIVSSLIFSNNPATTTSLTVNSGVTLTVSGGITAQNSASANTSVLIQGAGALSCASLAVGGSATPAVANSDFTATVTSTISSLSMSGNLTVNALYNSALSAANQGTFALGSGATGVGGSVSLVTVPVFGPTLTLAAGSQNGTLTLSGATPFTISGGGSSTFTPNGTSATVNYSGASQTVKGATYQNLVLSGSGTKTTTGVTVNGTLSLRGTAVVSAVPAYGASATLEFNGSAAQSSAPALPAGIPNLIINNTSGVTLAGGTTVSNSLTFAAGILTTGTNILKLAAAASASGSSPATYANGNVLKTFNSGTQLFTFPIGDATAYTPLTLSNLSVSASGSLKASTTAGNQPQSATNGIDSSRSVNRYWTITQSGGTFGTYDAAFNYTAFDIDAAAAVDQFNVMVWSGSAWAAATVNGIPSTNATSITGQNGFGDFVIGDPVTQSQVLSGTYAGNGTDNHAITGLGFQPDVVIVKCNSAKIAVIRSSTMAGDATKDMTGATALQSNRIHSLNTNGFTLGTDASVNSAGLTYQWIAFKASNTRMTVGTYTGNGASSNAITGLGFGPKFVLFMSASSNNLVMHSAQSILTYQLDAHSGNSMVDSLDPDGFTLGSDSRVNANGTTYHYVAWPVITGELASGSYSGNSADDQNVTGVGFQPEFVLVKSTSAYPGVQHPASLGNGVDLSQFFTASANVSNEVQALQPDGFQIGTAQDVNQSGAPYVFFAWKKIVLPSRLAITSVNGGASPAAGTPFNVVVQSQDAAGNADAVTMNTIVKLSLNTGNGILGGTLTGTIAAGSNTATLTGITYTRAESGVILTASRSSGLPLAPGNSSPFTVTPGPFAQLQLLMPGESAAPGTATGKTGAASSQTVGVALSITVNAVDAYWNPVSTNDTVSISSSDSAAILPANAALSGGVKTFSLTFKTAGSQSVTASDFTHGGIAPNTGSVAAVLSGNQTIAFPSPGNQTYGVGPITLAATASSGLQVGYAVTSGPATVSNNTLTLTGAGTVTIQASQPGNPNWNAATPVSQTITVSPKTLTASATVNSRNYDGTLAATVAGLTLSGVINSDDVSLTGGVAQFSDKNVGNGKAATVTGLSLGGGASGNYVLASSSASTTAAITPAVVTVTAIDTNRLVGAANPVFSTTYSGFVAGDSTNVLSGSPAVSTAADTNSPTGAYPIQVAQGTLNAANYTFAFVNGTLTVYGAPTLSLDLTIDEVNQTNQITLHATGLGPGSTWRILTSSNLSQWSSLDVVQVASDGTITYTNSSPVVSARYYRLSN